MSIPTKLIEPIVSHVKAEIRDQARAALDQALGNRCARPRGQTLTITAPNVTYSTGEVDAGRALTITRSTGEVDAARVLAYLRKRPRQSRAEIRAALGADPLAVLADLRAGKLVKVTGQRRGTRYSAR